MTEEQIRAAVHSLLGLWPYPGLEADESNALVAGLANHGPDEFRKAIELLGRQARQFRPAPQEIVAALRSVRRREQERFPALPPVPTVDPFPWLAKAREALADAAKASAAA
jgi:hypothetical protein